MPRQSAETRRPVRPSRLCSNAGTVLSSCAVADRRPYHALDGSSRARRRGRLRAEGPPQKFTTITDPHANTTPFEGTYGIDMNSAGTVVGQYYDASVRASRLHRPGRQVLRDQRAERRYRRRAGHGSLSHQRPRGDSKNVAHGFEELAGKFTTFNDPSAGTRNAPGTYLDGLPDEGTYLFGPTRRLAPAAPTQPISHSPSVLDLKAPSGFGRGMPSGGRYQRPGYAIPRPTIAQRPHELAEDRKRPLPTEPTRSLTGKPGDRRGRMLPHRSRKFFSGRQFIKY